MDRLPHYPDLFIQVLEHCNPRTLINISCTDKATRDLIQTYNLQICAAIAQREFPEALSRLQNYVESIKQAIPIGRALLERLTIYHVTSALASHVVANAPSEYYCQIPKDEPLGDPLRYRIENGFHVLWAFSEMAKGGDLALERASQRSLRSLPAREEKQARMKDICAEEAQKRLFEYLSPADCADFRLAHFYMGISFPEFEDGQLFEMFNHGARPGDLDNGLFSGNRGLSGTC